MIHGTKQNQNTSRFCMIFICDNVINVGRISYIGRGRRETNSSCVINLVIPLDDVLKKRVHIIN